MFKSNDQFYRDFVDDDESASTMDLSDVQSDFLDEFLEPFKSQEDFSSNFSSSLTTLDNSKHSAFENSTSLNSQIGLPTTTVIPVINQSMREHLQMIDQPCQNSKLRYRTDYAREKSRLGVLGNKTEKSKVKGPTIRISSCYLNPSDQYFIRVSLVTVKYAKTNLHYFHPYDLEHPKDESCNDRTNNSVWFPIDIKDSLKNFPLLRIVKKKAVTVQKFQHLRVFDCYHEISSFQHFLDKEIDVIKEYNIERSQLAFTLGKKTVTNGKLTMIVYANTMIFSDSMNEYDGKQSDNEADVEPSNERVKSSLNGHHIYKYAPRSGLPRSNEEVLIYLKKKLDLKRYGNLDVTIECDTSNGHWSRTVLDLNIKDRLISFRTPTFPYSITSPTVADIVLRQEKYILGMLKYSYLPTR